MAAQESQPFLQKFKHPHGASLRSFSEGGSQLAEGPQVQTQTPLVNRKDMQAPCNTLFEPLLDDPLKGTIRMCTAKSGNPLISVVHQSGVFDMEILYCICANAADGHEQLIHSGLFPSKLKQPSPSQCWMTS